MFFKQLKIKDCFQFHSIDFDNVIYEKTSNCFCRNTRTGKRLNVIDKNQHVNIVRSIRNKTNLNKRN